MTQTQHLCLFTDSLQPSGVGEHMLVLAAHLRGRYKLSLVCPPTETGLKLLKRAGQLVANAIALEARDDPSSLESLCGWLRANRVDLFHVHAGIGWEGFGGAHAARLAGVPHIVRTEHLPYLLTHHVQQSDHRQTINVVDLIICVGKGVGDSYLRQGVPHHKLRVVCNGVDPLYARRARLDRADVLSDLGLPPDALVAVTVGRFTAQKGHSTLLQAARAIVEGEPRAYFAWVGIGELEDALRWEAYNLRLQDRVLFLGSRHDVSDLLAASDLFVLPSEFEGLPLAMLEAMACGLPAVGTDVCGISEVIEEGVTGRLVPFGDADALAECITGLLQRPQLALKMGAAGKRRQAERFNIERMVAETLDVYRELSPVGGSILAAARV